MAVSLLGILLIALALLAVDRCCDAAPLGFCSGEESRLTPVSLLGAFRDVLALFAAERCCDATPLGFCSDEESRLTPVSLFGAFRDVLALFAVERCCDAGALLCFRAGDVSRSWSFRCTPRDVLERSCGASLLTTLPVFLDPLVLWSAFRLLSECMLRFLVEFAGLFIGGSLVLARPSALRSEAAE